MHVASRRSRTALSAVAAVVLAATALSAPTASAAPEDPHPSTRSEGPSRVDHLRAPGGGRADLPGRVESGASVARWVPGEVLVKYRHGVSASDRVATRSSLGAEVERRLPARGLELLSVSGGVPGAVRALERRPEVLYAQPNFVYRAAATPSDPRFAEQWPLRNTGQKVWNVAGVPGADIEAPAAWDRQAGDASVTVAVVDSGVAYDHPDLADNIWMNPGETTNGVDDDGNGYVDDVRGWDFVQGDNDPQDLSSHGTHVAGTVGAVGNNGVGVAGVAWDVSVMPVRVLGGDGTGTTADVVAGIDYAVAEGADVVNMSLGDPEFDQMLSDAIASAPDTLFVVAAGNDGVNNEALPTYPCDLTSANLICVAATDNRDRLADFSNYGSTSVDLAAPGVGILSTVPSKVTMRSEGFNSSAWANRWTTGGTSRWGVETDTNTGPFITDSPGGSYANGADNWVRTATPIDLAGRHGCRVDYWMWLDTEEGPDGLVVEKSTDGQNWTEVASWTGSSDGYWYRMSDYLDDGDLDGSGRAVYLRFHFVSDSSVRSDGVGIDDVDVNCLGAPYSGDEYDSYDGTSMASPHVAGAAAALFAAAPGASVQAVRNALLSGAEPVASLVGKTVTGARLNLKRSLYMMTGMTDVAFSPARTVVESVGPAYLTVTRTGDVSLPASVHYARSGGTAIPGADFDLSPGTLAFAAGQTSAKIPLSVYNDTTREAAETVKVNLDSPGASTVLGSPSTATLTIAPSDQRPDAWISTSSGSGYVGNNVYNTSGRRQTKTLSARRGQARTFYVRVYNDGNVTNVLTLKGTAAPSGSRVRYLAGSTNVTAAMRSKAGYSVKLGAGAYRLIKVQTTILSTARIGSLKKALVTGTWTGDGARTDVAKSVVKVVR